MVAGEKRTGGLYQDDREKRTGGLDQNDGEKRTGGLDQNDGSGSYVVSLTMHENSMGVTSANVSMSGGDATLSACPKRSALKGTRAQGDLMRMESRSPK